MENISAFPCTPRTLLPKSWNYFKPACLQTEYLVLLNKLLVLALDFEDEVAEWGRKCTEMVSSDDIQQRFDWNKSWVLNPYFSQRWGLLIPINTGGSEVLTHFEDVALGSFRLLHWSNQNTAITSLFICSPEKSDTRGLHSLNNTQLDTQLWYNAKHLSRIISWKICKHR